MSKLDHNIALLEEKIIKLIKESDYFKEEYSKLVQENNSLKKEIFSLQDSLSQYENQEKMSKIVTSLSESNSQSKELKENLDGYIKLIDKCLKYISEQ